MSRRVQVDRRARRRLRLARGRRGRQGRRARAATAEVIALSYGERGESGELWKQEGQTSRTSSGSATPRPRPPRGTSARRSAAWTSATTRSRSTASGCCAVADAIREFAPDVLITHTDTDPFNPDHPGGATRAVDRARGARRRRRRLERVRRRSSRRSSSCSSPTSPSCATSRRRCTSTSRAVWEQKVAAMAEMQAQQYLQTYYAQRGEQRGNHARRASGDSRGPLRPSRSSACCRRWSRSCDERRARPAGLGDRLRGVRPRRAWSTSSCSQLVPGSRACGPARTARCGQDDNLMVHAAMAALQPGEVLVLTMPEPAPVALLGDLLATQAQARGAAAVLVDAAVRDAEELAEHGPAGLGALDPLARRDQGRSPGELDVPVVVGGARDPPGRPRRARRRRRRPSSRPQRADEVLEASLAREAKEARQAREARRPARCPTSSTGCGAR